MSEHDLEDVASKDVLLGHLDGELVLLRRHARRGVGPRIFRVGRGHQGVGQRLAEIGRHHVDPSAGRFIGPCVGVGIAGREHVVDQIHPAPPVVESGHRSDNREHGIGQSGVIVRRVRETFDLPDGVVAEVPDDSAGQRRDVGVLRAAVVGEQPFETGEDTLVARHGDR